MFGSHSLFIFGKLFRAFTKRVAQVFVSTFVVRIEHCFSADEIFVGYLLCERK